MCEYQQNCGFYIYLLATDRITKGLDCPKPDKKACPRYKVRTGLIKDDDAQKIYNVKGSVYRHETPISSEESRM